MLWPSNSEFSPPGAMTSQQTDIALPRRTFLASLPAGVGLAGFAMAEQQASSTLAPRFPHFKPKAKRFVHLFMNGGPSQVDTFDPKPTLDKLHGKQPPGSLRTERKTAGIMRSPFTFKRYGSSGLEVSELFKLTATMHADKLCVVRSMVAEVPNHEPSLMLMNTGDGRLPRPCMGSWLVHGLGSEARNLPAFVVLCPSGLPVVGVQNWRSAFLPGSTQGVHLDTAQTDPAKLLENLRHPTLGHDALKKQYDLLAALNQSHQVQNNSMSAATAAMEARAKSFDMAYRMQSQALQTLDLKDEPESVKKKYGTTTHGRQLMLTRRLLEQGVRVVQVWSGGGQPWDNHDGLEGQHRSLAQAWDQPIAAFLDDLQQRGLLDDTLVLWSGEFGRTPVAELPALSGRDHSHYGFSIWMAGGGVRGGYAHGATDEFGFRAVEKPVAVHDLHATMLHLLGFNHEKLTFRHAGRDFRLTDVHGEVVRELLA